MRSERIAAISRFLITLEQNTAFTHSGQWFERTLDDSANRRLVLPQMFLAADSILQIYLNVVSGLQVYEKIIGRRVMENLPFIASENILMEAVNKGGDRQKLQAVCFDFFQQPVPNGQAGRSGVQDDAIAVAVPDFMHRPLRNELFQLPVLQFLRPGKRNMGYR